MGHYRPNGLSLASLPLLLTIFLLIPSQSFGKLSQGNLSNSITYAPRGIDHLLEPKPWFTRTRTNRSKKRTSAGSSIRTNSGTTSSSSSGTNSNNEQVHSGGMGMTRWMTSGFYTLHGSACLGRTQFAKVNSTLEGIVRMVDADGLSNVLRTARIRREHVFVMFHGGEKCKWSEQIWPVWIELVRRMRSACMLTIDGRKQSVHNYNMMVLGFPAIVRVGNERPQATYKGNRSVEEILGWMVRGSGIAPMGINKNEWDMKEDLEWFDIRQKDIKEVLKIGEFQRNEGIDWILVAANVVSTGNVGWWMIKVWRRLKEKRRRDD